MAKPKSVINNWAPCCALPGCTNRVGYHKQYTKADGTIGAKFKTFCEFHRTIGKITRDAFIKARGCENRDGRLGWVCTCSDDDPLTIDHVDGNRHNNDESNLQVLCHNSHARKTKINKDYLNSYNYTNTKFNDFFEISKEVIKMA